MLGRALLLVAFVMSCATDPVPPETPPDPFEQVWSEAIQPGDAIVGVPGTGGYTTLGIYIEAATDPAHPDVPPLIDARTIIPGANVLEGAIAAALRAGISESELEAGAIHLGLWGAGITKLTAFDYVSLTGVRVRFDVIGGTSVCASGNALDNLARYNADNADIDARDLYRRTQAWLAAMPPAPRHVTLVGHSWAGVVVEFTAKNLATLQTALGPLPDAELAYVIAAGVPVFLPDFARLGPGFRTVDSTEDELVVSTRTYEIDRPDDPVNTFDPASQGGGHHYIILFGEAFQGFYGITTDELSCGTTPGICPPRQ